MKIKHLILALLVPAMVQAQNVIQLTHANYTNLKQQGQLDLSKTYRFTDALGPKAAPIHYQGEQKTPSTICSCMVPLDTTFSLVPFNYAIGPDYRNDDGSTNAIALPFSFNLYGVTYDSVFINNNGNISFSGPYATFTAFTFPDSTYKMVAPFWADVDTRDSASGLVYYKITPTAMIVKWESVGYYNMMSDLLNTFQLIITDGTDPLLPPGNNVGFCYDDMQWTTGAASGGIGGFGGTPATVGMNMGNGTDYFQVGTFDSTSTVFDGPYGAADGVDWLDNQGMYFNSSIPGNIPPVVINNMICDTIDVYTGDTLHTPLYNVVNFRIATTTPEIGQTVSTIITCSEPTALSTVQTVSSATYNQFDCTFSAVGLSPGTYTVSVTATDDGHPALSTTKNIVFRTHYDPLAPMGIEENNTMSSIAVYPNPANDHLNVSHQYSMDQKPSLVLTDVLGRNVQQWELVGKQQRIALPELPAGIYFVQIKCTNENSGTLKLVIR